MATKTNAEIAAAFDELGDLYELDGAVSYRVIAYRTAAKAVRDASVSIMALTREGKVTTVPGIGKTLEEKLKALDETGDIPSAVKLRAKFPSGLISIMHLPGFGAKRAKLLYDELGIDSLEKLREAAEAEQIRKIRGLGKRVEENLLRVLAEQEEGGGPAPRILLSRAIPVAEQIAGALRDHPAAHRVEIAGSVRRMGDTAKDIDIIATADDVEALISTLAELELVESRGRPGRRGRAREDALGDEGRPAGRRARPVRQRPAALHRLQGPQRAAARGRRAARAARLRVRDPRRRDRRDAALRDRGGGLRAARLRVDPAGAARGARRAGGGARRQAAEADRARATCAATCTATRR